MKCVTANPQGSKEGSPLRRAYLLLLSSQSPHKSCPDLCFNVLRVTNVPTLASCLTPSEHCLTLSYLYVLITNEAEIMTFFFIFVAEPPRRPCIRSAAYAAQGDAEALPSSVAVTHALAKAGRTLRFSLKQRCKDEFTASRNRTGGAESHQLLDYDLLWSFAGHSFHKGIETWDSFLFGFFLHDFGLGRSYCLYPILSCESSFKGIILFFCIIAISSLCAAPGKRHLGEEGVFSQSYSNIWSSATQTPSQDNAFGIYQLAACIADALRQRTRKHQVLEQEPLWLLQQQQYFHERKKKKLVTWWRIICLLLTSLSLTRRLHCWLQILQRSQGSIWQLFSLDHPDPEAAWIHFHLQLFSTVVLKSLPNTRLKISLNIYTPVSFSFSRKSSILFFFFN